MDRLCLSDEETAGNDRDSEVSKSGHNEEFLPRGELLILLSIII